MIPSLQSRQYPDIYWPNVALALKQGGANGLQNATFIDSSVNNFTITPSANVTQGSFSPFDGFGGSTYFDGGASDYLTVTDNSQFDTDASFTLECWFYMTSISGQPVICGRGGGGASWSLTNGHLFLALVLNGTFYWQWNNSGTPAQITQSGIAARVWYRLVVGFDGTTTRVWINGVSVGSSTSGYSLPATRNIFKIGNEPSLTSPFTGYISNFRFTKSDVYGVGNTTIPISNNTLDPIANTALLLKSENAGIYDASAKSMIETFGNAQVSYTQQKFASNSIAFDGSGDYLSISSPIPSNFDFKDEDWTIQGWVYLNVAANYNGLFSKHVGAQISGITANIDNSGNLLTSISNAAGNGWTLSGIAIASGFTPGVWHHFAIMRYGSYIVGYRNGVQGVTQNIGTASIYSDPAANFFVGNSDGGNTGSGQQLNGYLADFYVYKKIALYATPNFDPFFNSVSTLLLGQGANAGTVITDSAPTAPAMTNFTVTTSTSVVRVGTSSLFFNGASALSYTGSSSSLAFGTGDFTIEFWVYRSSGTSPTILDMRLNGTTTVAGTIYISTNFRFHINAADVIVGTTTVASSTWYHIAVSRVSGSTRMFVNGIQEGSTYADSNSYVITSTMYFGGNTDNTQYLTGYMANIRITKGVGRYSSTFTPSTSLLFDLQGDAQYPNTALLIRGDGVNAATSFTDLSLNAYPINRAGTVALSNTVRKFNTNATSIAFGSSSTDSLLLPTTSDLRIGTGDFSLEMWAYPKLVNGSHYTLIDGPLTPTGQRLILRIESGTNDWRFFNGNAWINSNSAATVDTWTHLQISRVTGLTKMYINGTGQTSTNGVNVSLGQPISIGNDVQRISGFSGYLQDIRFTKSVARNTGNFAVPILTYPAYSPSPFPYTEASSSEYDVYRTRRTFLLPSDGAQSGNAFLDKSLFRNQLTPVGNVITSTIRSKYGGSSLRVTGGNGDYLSGAASSGWAFRSGDFTVEFWTNPSVTFATSRGAVVGNIVSATGSSSWMAGIQSGKFQFAHATAVVASGTSTVVADNFYHFAYSRVGSVGRLFVNGSGEATVTDTNDYSLSNPLIVGNIGSLLGFPYSGYIDDLSIVSGISLYNSSFIPKRTSIPTY